MVSCTLLYLKTNDKNYFILTFGFVFEQTLNDYGTLFLIINVRLWFNEKKLIDIIIIGFALFAIFFGASNPDLPTLPWCNGWKLGNYSTCILNQRPTVIGCCRHGRCAATRARGRTTHSPCLCSCLECPSASLIGPILPFQLPERPRSKFSQSYVPDAPQWITSLLFFGIVLWITYQENSVSWMPSENT